VRLKAGSYSITAKADKFVARTENIEVPSGNGVPIDWRLSTAEDVVEKVTIGTEGLDGQLTPGDWREVRSSFSMFKEKMPGTFFFNIRLSGNFFGKKRATFVVNWTDPRNYLEYVLDDTSVTQNTVTNGRKTEGTPVQHKFGKPADDYFQIMVQLEANKVTISGHKNGGYTALSQHSHPGNILQGKFGFPKDQSINQFRFEGTRKK
jgi:hypothetical protein